MEDMFFCLALVLSVFLAYRLLFTKKHNYPPGPPALPIVGHLHLIKSPIYRSFQNVSNRLGPIVLFWMGKVPLLVISSPAAVEECFTKNDVVFANRPSSISTEHLTYNNTFLVWAQHGPLWRSLRRLTFADIFSPKAIHRSASIRDEEVRHLASRLLQYPAGGNKPKVDMRHMFSLLTANVIMRVVVGRRLVQVNDEDTEEEKRLLEQFKCLFVPVVSMTVCDFIPALRLIGFKGIEKSIIKLKEKREVFLNNLMAEARARRAAAGKRENGNSEEGDKITPLIDSVLSLQETNPQFYTDDILKGLVMMSFIAGTETSSTTMEWGLTLLLRHPEKMHKLQAEIDSVVGDNRLLNDSDFANLPYLKAVVKETLRLYPPAPVLLPHFSTDSTTIGGYEIPKGTMLMVNAWSMHRDPKLWDDPNEFIPERFEESDRDGYLYVPFGAGRRACPGAGVATYILSMSFGLLVQLFEWDKISMGEDTNIAYSDEADVLHKSKPLEASFAPRPKMAKLLTQL